MRSTRHLAAIVLAVVATGWLAAGCADLQLTSGSGSTSDSHAPVGIDFSNPSALPAELAARLGCSDFSGSAQLEWHVTTEGSCLLDGDHSVMIFAFDSTAAEAAWFAAGMQSADDSGTVVLGDTWAVEPFDASQAAKIQMILGGQIKQQR